MQSIWSRKGLLRLLAFLFFCFIMQYFAYSGEETNTFYLVISYINFGIAVFFWGSFVTVILTAAISALIQKLYGCELIYLKIFGTLFIKEDGKLKRRKAVAIELAEPVYMMPPENISPKLWLCGFVYVSIALTAIYAILAVLLPKSFWITGVLIILAAKEFFFLISIPKLPGNPFNIIKQLKDDEKARRLFINSHRIYGLHLSGTNMWDMPYEWFELPTEEEFAAKPLVYSGITALAYSRLMDEGRFLEARQLAEMNYNIKTALELTDYLKYAVRADFLFCVIMDGCDRELIARICGDGLIEHLKSKDGILVYSRLLYAYKLLVNKNTTKAAERFADFEKLSKSCPVKTITDSEQRIIKHIHEKIL